MIYDLDTHLTYLYEARQISGSRFRIIFSLYQEEYFAEEQWEELEEDGDDQLANDDNGQDDDSVVGEETAIVDEEIEDIIEELNTEKLEILEGIS